MTSRYLRVALLTIAFAIPATGPAFAAEVSPVVWMESVEVQEKTDILVDGPPPRAAYRPITDPERLADLRRFEEFPGVKRSLLLYRAAHAVSSGERADDGSEALPPAPPLHVALVQGGNHAAHGFDLVRDGRTEPRPDTPYMLASPKESFFRKTFIHETGHIVTDLLSGNRIFRSHGGLSSLPHTTYALTDRYVAFNEGFGIHLEAVSGHFPNDDRVLDFYQHRWRPGPPGRVQELLFPLTDYMTYSQSFARYRDVRDNAFVFRSALENRGPRRGYLIGQMLPPRDPRKLRNGSQLMASEGFVATFFLRVAERGLQESPENEAIFLTTYETIFRALRLAFDRALQRKDDRFLPLFVEAFGEIEPADRKEIIALFLELTKGVTVDGAAHGRWLMLHDKALVLDRAGLPEAVRQVAGEYQRALEHALRDSSILSQNIGPVVPVRVPGVKVGLERFGRLHTLVFDANAATPEQISALPGVSPLAALRLIHQRDFEGRWFRDYPDFLERAGLEEAAARGDVQREDDYRSLASDGRQ